MLLCNVHVMDVDDSYLLEMWLFRIVGIDMREIGMKQAHDIYWYCEHNRLSHLFFLFIVHDTIRKPFRSSLCIA